MASGHNDPKLLYAIPGVSAYHISNGVEDSLTPAGPQTLSLLMVPAASPFADRSVEARAGEDAEEDFYLHLHLPPELDLPLPATTQIYHQPPTSYLIPRWDAGRNSGVFTRIEFPPVGSRKGLQEDVDTFETILAQCTAFLERSPPPRIVTRKQDGAAGFPPSPPSLPPRAGDRDGQASTASRSTHQRAVSASRSTKSSATVMDDPPAYNPADFRPGEAYAPGSHSSMAGGQIVLIDEEDGSVIGELGEGFQVVEDKTLKPGSKDPVEITLPTDVVPTISVAPARYVDPDLHPAYKKSTLVSNAMAASRLIVATSEVVSRALQSQADSFAQKATPAARPMTFQPTTHKHIRRINTFSASAAGISAKAVEQVGKVAQNLGASLAGHKALSPGSTAGVGGSSHRGGGSGSGHSARVAAGGPARAFGANGEPLDNFKPGLLNKSLMAFSTVADGIEQAGRHLLDTSTVAATTVAARKWGPEAGEVTKNLSSGIRNVGLVYIDVTGVSRRAIIKSVAKGMVVGRVPGGGDLIVGGGDGGVGLESSSSSISGGEGSPASRLAAPPSHAGSIRSRSVSRSRSGNGANDAGIPSQTSSFSDKNPYRGR